MSHYKLAHLLGPFALAAALLFSIPGCRDKHDPTGPDDPGIPGAWSIHLTHAQKLRRVGNDTITVRVYSPQGVHTAGIFISSRASSGVNVVTQATTSRSDTATHWWGAEPAIIYWGEGDSTGHDTVRSWAIQTGVLDTLAETITVFEVVD